MQRKAIIVCAVGVVATVFIGLALVYIVDAEHNLSVYGNICLRMSGLKNSLFERTLPARTIREASETVEQGYDLNKPLNSVLHILGTHNSYHVQTRFLGSVIRKHSYTHPPLDVQMEHFGVRSVELDLHRGFLVYHVGGGIDSESNCRCFGSCLADLRAWSLQRPGHVPILVMIELKTDQFDRAAGWRWDPLSSQTFLDLETQIEMLWPRKLVISPGELYELNRDRAAENKWMDGNVSDHRVSWPLLKQTAGKILFMVDSEPFMRNEHAIVHHVQARPNSLMFLLWTGECRAPHCFVAKRDDPVAQGEEIGSLAERGILVRTRADADLVVKDKRREAAWSSGAHIVSTDFEASYCSEEKDDEACRVLY